jgi:hypothetical protein
MTASLSGCTFIVDEVENDDGHDSHDLIAYHANVMDKEGAPLAVDVQPLGVSAGLDHLWIMAQHDYERAEHATIAAIPHRLRLGLGASVAKPRYNRGAGALVRRKIGMSRYNVNFAGGASVFGFVEHGAWAFYFQTWGDLTYNRPWFAGLYHLAWRKTEVEYKVLECARFYPRA